ncbi:unnamed protein product [Rotaria magnacalcarata]
MNKSASLDSLKLPTSTSSILTSTVNPATQPSAFPRLTRRIAIIPTPNRPAKIQKSDKVESCINEDKPINSGNNNNQHILLSNKQSSTELLHLANNQSTHEDNNKDEEDEDSLFDIFICENFLPFSSIQSVDQWLDETETLFNTFKISRKLRSRAVPLLVKGEPKRKYIKNRHSITSFDDFYEFLLIHCDTSALVTSSSLVAQPSHKTEIVKDSICISTPTVDSKSYVENTTDSTQISQLCASCSNKVTINDTTKVDGDVSESKSTVVVSSTDTLSLDPVSRDLRKAIVTDFIKNPKLFTGHKDNVKKWVEDIEHIMQIAHVPETTRLDLVSYALRGDALQWYKNNKDTLTSWKKFLEEIKKAFLSSFCE